MTALGSGMKGGRGTLKDYREKGDRAYLTVLVAEVEGNISAAARIAGMSRTGIYRLLRKYGIEVREEEPCTSP